MSSWRRVGRAAAVAARKRPAAPKHQSRRPLALGFHALEAREMMSADGLEPQGLYDAGAAYISPVWFQQLGESTAARGIAGGVSIEGSIGKLDWAEQSIDVYLDEWIVQLKRDAIDQIQSLSEVASLFAPCQFGIEVIGGLGMAGQVLVRTSGASTDMVTDWFDNQDLFAYYEPNAILPLTATPNDPNFSQLWGLNNTGQTGGRIDADIDAPEAWNVTTGSSSIVVGVIDTGVDYNHPDLAANIWTNPGEIAGNGIDDDGNGFVDDIHGFDFVNNDGDPMDDHGHGTHCAGTIAGRGNNGQGVAGVAWNSSVMALKFLSSSGSGSISNAVRALNYATMMRTMYGVDIRVTSNSWGGGGYSSSMDSAILASEQAGMLFVAAAGNDAQNNDVVANYPSNYTSASVIAVAATDHNDNLASFSNYGATTVDLAAPGVNIYSCRPGGGYQYMSGTSMATPHVAGAVALLWSANPSASASEIKAALLAGVDPVASLSGKVATGGRLNVMGGIEEMGIQVAATSPSAGSTVTTPLTSFTVDFTQNYLGSSVQASDFTVNGTAANSFTLVDANTIRFGFTNSPVTTQGAQTMRIAEGAIAAAGGSGSIRAWQSTFFYDQVALSVVSATPAEGQTVSATPASITLVFNEALNAASVGLTDLVLSDGSVTGATLVSANSVRYSVSMAGVEGPVSFTLAAGAVTDAFGTPNTAYVGHFTVDDPSVSRYLARDLPRAISDMTTVASTITITDTGTIHDLDIELDITHTWLSDLTVELMAPDGTRFKLIEFAGGSGDNFTGTILDDEASAFVGDGSAPFSGRFRPQVPLSTLDGKSITGTWTLLVTDSALADQGTLNSWGIRASLHQPLVMAPIADQTMSHRTDAISVSISLSDTGQPATVSAAIASLAYDLDRQHGLWASSTMLNNNYYYNMGGCQEKWLYGNNASRYYIVPSGHLYRVSAGSTVNEYVTTLEARCWENPELLWNAQPPASIPVQLSYNAQTRQLTIDPSAGFVGEFDVKVTATAGAASASRYFHVSVTNGQTTLAAIPNQTASPRQDTIQFQAQVSNPDGDPLTYTVTAGTLANAQALAIDAEHALWAPSTIVDNNYYYNMGGCQEKWFYGNNASRFYIVPSGHLYRVSAGTRVSEYVATLNARYWQDPELLWNAQPIMDPIAATVSATGLVTIDPPAGFTGRIQGTVTVNDGASPASRSFTIDVISSPPALGAIAPITLQRNSGIVQFNTQVTNTDNDPLTYTVTAYGVANSAAIDVQSQHGLYATPAMVESNYSYNQCGFQEKWLKGSNDCQYYILPDGRLHRWEGRFAISPVVALLPSTYWSDPAQLTNIQPITVPITATVDANGCVTVTPPAYFMGSITGTVTVSDGGESDSERFTIQVVNHAPIIDSVSGQAVAAGVATIHIDASDPDRDVLLYHAGAVASGTNTAYEIDQQHGLWAPSTILNNNYYYNMGGCQEKWLYGSNASRYYIVPSGHLYRVSAGSQVSEYVATLDMRYWQNPELLWNAQRDVFVAATSISPSGQLTVTTPSGFRGWVDVAVSVTDGAAHATQNFRVTIGGGAAATGMQGLAVQGEATAAMSASTPAISVPSSLQTAGRSATTAAWAAAVDYVVASLRLATTQPLTSIGSMGHEGALEASLPGRAASTNNALERDAVSTERCSATRVDIAPRVSTHRNAGHREGNGRLSDAQLLRPLAEHRVGGTLLRAASDAVYSEIEHEDIALVLFDAQE
ncbi:MAG: S8 family serine peptidase [Planctomycetota bacterium]